MILGKDVHLMEEIKNNETLENEVAEASVTETSAAEVPVAETPVAETLTETEEIKTTETSAVEEPATDVPVTEEPDAETTVVETSPVVEVPVAPVAAAPVKEPAKKGNGLAIAVIAIIVLLIAAGGFAFYWFTRPIYKVNHAIEAGDYKTATEYFGEISEEDKEVVTEQFLSYCEDKKTEYVDEDIEYDEFVDEMELFEDILEDEDDYQDYIQYAAKLNASREAWKDAQKAYDNADYFKAYAACAEVIEEDKNYPKALDMREECQNLMVIGEWVAEADLSTALAEQVGVDPSEISFAMKIIYIFDEYGKAILKTDTDHMREQMSGVMDVVIDKTISAYCESYGVTVEEMDEVFENFYGMSFSDYVKENMSLDDVVSAMDRNDEYTYSIEGNSIVLTDVDGNAITDRLTVMEDGTIALNSDDPAAVYESLGVELPLIFNRQ